MSFSQGTPLGDTWRNLDSLFFPRPAAPSAPAVSKHCQCRISSRSCVGGTRIPLFRIFVISYSSDLLPIFFSFSSSSRSEEIVSFQSFLSWQYLKRNSQKKNKALFCADRFLLARFQSVRQIIKVSELLKRDDRNLSPREVLAQQQG